MELVKSAEPQDPNPPTSAFSDEQIQAARCWRHGIVHASEMLILPYLCPICNNPCVTIFYEKVKPNYDAE